MLTDRGSREISVRRRGLLPRPRTEQFTRGLLTGNLAGGELESQHSARAELSCYREVTYLRSHPCDSDVPKSGICSSGMPTRAGHREGLWPMSLPSISGGAYFASRKLHGVSEKAVAPEQW